MTAPRSRIFGWPDPEELGPFPMEAPRDAPPVEASRSNERWKGLIVPSLALAGSAPAVRHEPAKDQRAAPRRRVLLGGSVVFGQGAQSLVCTIRDLSDDGARVRLKGLTALPAQVFLIEMRRGLAFEAKVAWAAGGEVGG